MGEMEYFAESVVNTVREPLLILDKDLRVITAGLSFYSTFEVTEEATVGQLVFDLGNGQWDIPDLRRLLLEILPERTTIESYEVVHRFEAIGEKIMLLNARKIRTIDELILLAIEDITERKKAENERDNLIKKLQKAVSEIKTLREILPICSFCKNIRNDEGYYEQIEAYFHHRSGVDFSHTICPECLKQHYPREYKEIQEEKSKK